MISFLKATPKVVNIGSGIFLKDLENQNVDVVSLDWRPPARGNTEIINLLNELSKYENKIDQANDLVVERMKATEAFLVGMSQAIDVVPGLKNRMILHSGPPVTWENMCGPQKGAVLGAILYEGWATNLEEAQKLIASNSIELATNHDFDAVGPMAGVLSPSMPVHVVYDPVHNHKAFCNVNEGLGGVLRFGKNTPDVIERLKWIEKVFYPVMKEALELSDGIDIRNIVMNGLNMGDECHNRNKASTSLFYKDISTLILKTKFDEKLKLETLEFIKNNDHYFLNLSMPYCKLASMAADTVKDSTIVSIMARNGYEFGIKMSGNKDWITHEANYVKGLYFPGYSEDDAARDLGDSAITETNGIGGFAMAASPAIVKFVGGKVEDAFRYSDSMNEITWSNNPSFTLPPLNFQPTALGIDVRKVLLHDILPIINTGIAHKEAGIGQIGAGLVTPPYEIFEKALKEILVGIEAENNKFQER